MKMYVGLLPGPKQVAARGFPRFFMGLQTEKLTELLGYTVQK